MTGSSPKGLKTALHQSLRVCILVLLAHKQQQLQQSVPEGKKLALNCDFMEGLGAQMKEPLT